MRNLEELKNKILKQKKRQNSHKPISNSKNFSAITVSSEIIGAVAFGFIIGSFLDHLFDTRFIFKLILLFLAMLTSFYTIYKRLR
ncbi:MAG: AtpZ/AtpI family protein [Rickettsiales bacterium]